MSMYGLSLSDIERNYGCVTEYYRSQYEDAAHEAELEQERWERYRVNQKRIDDAADAGTLVYMAWSCVGCKDYTAIGMTSPDDDIEHGVCGDPACKTCQYRKEADDGTS